MSVCLSRSRLHGNTSLTWSVVRLAVRELDRSIFPTRDCGAAIACVLLSSHYTVLSAHGPRLSRTVTWKMTKGSVEGRADVLISALANIIRGLKKGYSRCIVILYCEGWRP